MYQNCKAQIRQFGVKAGSLLGIDRALAWAAGGRGLGMLLGPIGSLVVVYTLSIDDQGTYYLFLSLVSLYALFDLGASAAIGQLTPHLIKETNSQPTLPNGGFIRTAVRLMNGIAMAFALVVGPGGIFYLHHVGQTSTSISLMWLATVAATAMTGAQEGRLKILYGAGNVTWTNKLRFNSLLLRYPLQWALLFGGASLFSFSASLGAVFLWQRFMMKRRYPELWLLPRRVTCEDRSIKKQLQELIGRSTITYASGIFVFNIQQPIIYKYLGPEASARFGFTSMIGGTLIGLASLWGSTRFPEMARKIAEKRNNEALIVFKRTAVQTVIVALFGLIVTFGALDTLSISEKFSERLMTQRESIPLFVALFIQTVASMMTYWPRSFKKEPFVWIAMIQMFITPLAVWYFARVDGLMGVGLGNCASWVVGFAGISWIVKQYCPGGNNYKNL